MSKCQFGLALECLHHAKDYSGLLLLATSAGDANTLERLAESSTTGGKNNITFTANFLLGRLVCFELIEVCLNVCCCRLEECLQLLISTGRLAEAAFFARTYLPSEISR